MSQLHHNARLPKRIVAATVAAGLLYMGFASFPRLAVGAPPTLGPNPQATDVAGASPSPIPTDPPRHHHHHGAASQDLAVPSAEPSSSASPAGPTFTSFEGTWEVAFQPGRTTQYSYFTFDGSDSTSLHGRWLQGRTTIVINGELDGDRFRFSGSNAQGPFSMSGYEEGAVTMVGLYVQGNTRTTFTATHQGAHISTRTHTHKHGHHETATGSNG